jgi:hypothetical protein
MTTRIAGTREGLDKGTTYLHHAAELWSLVNPRRGEAIHTWLRNEWAAHPEHPDLEVYDVASLRLLLGLLDGLGDALAAELTDASWRLDAQTAARLLASHPTLIDSWQGAEGTVYTLANRVSEALQIEALVRRAVALDRGLEVG